MKKLETKPFALIGVNLMKREPKALKEFMGKEKLGWRSFADGSVIAGKWSVSATPTFYLLDARGTIRRKWTGAPGATALEAAIDELLREVAGSAGQASGGK